jgi:cob(I)alamin adenosyltransferase
MILARDSSGGSSVPRIYTRTGDGGQTGLIGGSRTSKADPRVDLYGDVDELNCALGMAIAQLLHEDSSPLQLLAEDLERIQTDLLELGALLADPVRCRRLTDEPKADLGIDGAALEPIIDRLTEPLPRLSAFILPGGAVSAAALHVARTVCRRVERKAVLQQQQGTALPAGVIVYLNRLSDLLFTAARFVNHAAGRDDVLWPGHRTSRRSGE